MTARYRAFISYSHRDKTWGDWLHRELERYRVPRKLVGRETRMGPVPPRLFPIFRDREELPTTSDLSQAIDEALRNSLFLIVMCSPAAAASQWVNAEIRAFKALHGEDRILAIVVDGEPNATDKGAPEDECFPEALRYRIGPDGALTDERTEPIAADARPHGDGRDDALLKLLSGLLAVNFNDLKQREVQAARRRARIAQGIAAAMALLAVAAAGAGWIAIKNQRIAEQQRAVAVTQRQIAEAETRRADAEAETARAQTRIAEARLREALIERTGREIADGRAAAEAGRPERAIAHASSALETALSLGEAALTSAAEALARDLLMTDRLEAALEGWHPQSLSDAALRDIQVSRDGRLILALRGDRLWLWRRMTGEQVHRITGVAAAAFLPDGSIGGLLSGGQVFAIDTETMAARVTGTVAPAPGASGYVRSALPGPGGDVLATIQGERLSLVDLASGQANAVLAVDAGGTERLIWAPQGDHLAALDSLAGRFRVWRIGDRALVVDLTIAGGVSKAVMTSDGGALIETETGWQRVDLATSLTQPLGDTAAVDDMLAGPDGTLVMDHPDGPRLTDPDGRVRAVMGDRAVFGLVGLRADGREVVLRHAEHVAVHDMATGGLLRRVGRAGGAPAGFHMPRSGDYLALIDEDGLITVWSLADGRETLALRPEPAATRIAMLDAPMGALLLVQDEAGHVTLHRAEAARLTGRALTGFGAPLAGGLIEAIGSWDDPVRLWDIATRHPVRTLPGPVLATDAAGRRLLSRAGGGLAVTTLGDAAAVMLDGDVSAILAAVFGPGNQLVVLTPDGPVLFDTRSGERRATWAAPFDGRATAGDLAFDPSGDIALALTADQHLMRMDLRAGTTEVIGLPRPADGLVIAADGGSALLRGTRDEPALRFDLATGELSPVEGPVSAIWPTGFILTGEAESRLVAFDGGETLLTLSPGAEAPALGPLDGTLLSQIAGDTLTGAPDMLVAQAVDTQAELWRIEGRRPFGTRWRPPVLSVDEAWALVSDLGPEAAYLVDMKQGAITAVVPSEGAAYPSLRTSPDLSAAVLSDSARSSAFDLRPGWPRGAPLLAALRARARTAAPPVTTVTPCDEAAGHPHDPRGVAPGRQVDEIPFDASATCRAALAVTRGPDQQRLTYQLSRALDAEGRSAEAVAMLEALAEDGYPMAGHALGLWRLGGVGGGPDDAARHFRKAAEAGVGAAWVALAQMEDAGMATGLSDALGRGAAMGAPDALRAMALAKAAAGDLAAAHRLAAQARHAAVASQPHRVYGFEALAVTLARRLPAPVLAAEIPPPDGVQDTTVKDPE